MRDRFDLPLRITVDDPVPGFFMALQRGATATAEMVRPVTGCTFDFTVTVDGTLKDGRPRLLGPCVQGPPDARFIYLVIHRPFPPWSGRAKVPLKAMTWADIEALKPNERLCAHYSGQGRNGLPACATVPLRPPGWIAE